jgi:cardiolipin synthase
LARVSRRPHSHRKNDNGKPHVAQQTPLYRDLLPKASELMSYLPNIITLFRIAMVPVLILLLKEQAYLAALLVFALAGVSDGLDGYLAKRFDCQTHLGAVLDPVADKLLLVSSYVMLTVLHQIPFWLLLTVAFRDFLIVGGYLVYVSLHGPVRMRPSYLSKFNTVMQITLVVTVLGGRALGLPLTGVVSGLVYVVFVTTVVSGGHYLWQWLVKGDIETAPGEKDGGHG